MPLLDRFTAPLWDLDTAYLFDDFEETLSTNRWTATLTDTGTAAVGDALGGILTVTPSDGTVADNDEAYVASAKALFQFTAGRNLYARFRLTFTETASGVYNAFAGFMSSVGANAIVDDGGGLRASGSILAIHKIDGETVWRFTVRNGSNVTTTASVQSAVMASGVYQVLEVQGEDVGNGSFRCCARVNGKYLTDANGLVIRPSVLISGSSLMQVGFGAKLGAVTNNDLLLVDHVYAAQGRGSRAA